MTAVPSNTQGSSGSLPNEQSGADSRLGHDVPWPVLLIGVTPGDVARLLAGSHTHPHHFLGAHGLRVEKRDGVVIRAFHPDAERAEVLLAGGGMVNMKRHPDGGLFAAFLPGAELPLAYRLRFHFGLHVAWEREDPYRFLPTVGDVDLHLFNEGTHRALWKCLGAHVRNMDGVSGVSFAVWAPAAQRVSVVGDFCRWDGRLFPMRQMGSSGVFEIFIPGLRAGDVYKYEIKGGDGCLRLKADPFAFAAEMPPSTASRVHDSTYAWKDDEWMRRRAGRDASREPVSIYEVHLASWRRVPEEGNRRLTYRELAPLLVNHVKRFGFTHVELLPVAEHPFDGSWGYQVTGYYAPTVRFGPPDDFKYLVDTCHQHGIGVIIDWVPAHFPRDDFALRRFDGTALYEHDDPRLGEHPDWGTLIFNYGRHEVRNFLIANAIYWLSEYHVDGLRVDAVASMLYLDYSRKEGEWLPNRYGGRENLDAIEFIKSLNATVGAEQPGCLMIAEESTAWGGVTKPVHEGGLGFHFKWNMGWMHDTLLFFSKEPIHRRYHLNDLTFAMLYEHTERFLMSLSHDEVVHGKRALLERMPGDEWQRFANLRLLLAYQYTRPGKKLLFMGTEIAPWHEWNYRESLDWHLADQPLRQGLMRYMTDLGQFYHSTPALWRNDHDWGGFQWIDCHDHENTVLAFVRWSEGEHRLVVLNFTPVPRDNYRLGAPVAGDYELAMTTDEQHYGGSQYPVIRRLATDPVSMHGQAQSLSLRLPPLGALILKPVDQS